MFASKSANPILKKNVLEPTTHLVEIQTKISRLLSVLYWVIFLRICCMFDHAISGYITREGCYVWANVWGGVGWLIVD